MISNLLGYVLTLVSCTVSTVLSRSMVLQLRFIVLLGHPMYEPIRKALEFRDRNCS